jgi:hypothetical protein
VYAGLPDALDRRLARVVADYDATVREVSRDELPREADGRPPPAGRARAVTPGDPRCLSLWLVLTDEPTVRLWTTGPVWLGLPMCTCDACDTDLGDLLEQLDGVLEDVTGGVSMAVSGLRRVRVDTRSTSSWGTAWYTRGEARALGLRRGRWRWPPWLERA